MKNIDQGAKELESTIQARLIARYTAQGWLVVRLIQTNLNGCPDLLLLRDGVARFVEVKRPGCKPRPLQQYRAEQLRAAGFSVDVVSSSTPQEPQEPGGK